MQEFSSCENCKLLYEIGPEIWLFKLWRANFFFLIIGKVVFSSPFWQRNFFFYFSIRWKFSVAAQRKGVFFFYLKCCVGQLKDMALKASGAYRQCKPCSGATGQHGNYADSETASASERFHCSYRRTGSSSSTPRLFGKEIIKGISSGEATPSMSGRKETGSTRAAVVFMEEDEPKEWVAQVEPGVLITFVSLPQGGNDLKRIRFRYSSCLMISLHLCLFIIIISV